MKKYLVYYEKNGNSFESIVIANSAYEARKFIASEKEIFINFEITDDSYDTIRENNHVGAVIEIR